MSRAVLFRAQEVVESARKLSESESYGLTTSRAGERARPNEGREGSSRARPFELVSLPRRASFKFASVSISQLTLNPTLPSTHYSSSDDEDDDFRAPSPISLAPSGYLAPQPSLSNRYGISSSSKTIDSDLPLAQSAAPPAGHFASGAPSGSGGDYQQDYEFDAQPPRAPPRRWWKEIDWDLRGVWRSRGKVEEGVTRRIVLNDPVGNEQTGFERNSVSTGKYNVVTFLPIFFFGESLSRISRVEIVGI